MKRFLAYSTLGSMAILAASSATSAVVFEEHFNAGFITGTGQAVTPPDGWVIQNNSAPGGSTSYFQGNGAVFPAFDGDAGDYLGANFNNTSGTNTISNWIITPVVTAPANGSVSFYTRGPNNVFPDRLELRSSTGSTDVGTTPESVGDFTNLLLTVNAALTPSPGYPVEWTQQSFTFPSAFTGRLAFRYFVTDGGPSGANSNYIGIDALVVSETAPPPPPPPPPAPDSTDLGTIVGGDRVIAASIPGGVVNWYKLTLTGTVQSGGAFDFFEISTGDPAIVPESGNVDTEIGLFSATGTLIANDDDSSYGFGSLLTFGEGSGVEPNSGGFNGNLVAGTYYLAVSGFETTFANGFNVVPGTTSGSFNIILRASGTATITGDYNGDGFVDAADYTVWADNFGQTGSSLPGDGNNDGIVDAADYTIWADNFGQGTPPGGPGAVPEPAALAFMGLPLMALRRRR